ncbi:MAG: MBL fold metallo-hydrolase [Crocinitomicaceae bacterium]|jgi:hydroxyacylglutathione hydrolase|nr:MBL fold metallo-hydrolase [Crocinitomicaceae bacterium]
MISVQKFSFNGFQENTYVVFDQQKNCVVIDPGCYERHEEQELLSFIKENGLTPLALLNTHAHIDHVLGNQFVLETFSIPFYLHENDLNTLHSVENYAHLYGFGAYKKSPHPTHFLNDGDELVFGSIKFKVKFTPGHAPGHVVFYNEENNFVINGDVLFNGSFGRVDLPGGDLETLKNSIFNVMFKLPDETLVYCGHGSETTIGKEKRSNYILQF